MNFKKILKNKFLFQFLIGLISPDSDGVDELEGVDNDVDAVDDEEDERRHPEPVVVDENPGCSRSNKVTQEETG